MVESTNAKTREAPSQFSEAYALLIGNSDYSERRDTYGDLELAPKDVKAVKKFLGSCDIKFDEITPLYNAGGEDIK